MKLETTRNSKVSEEESVRKPFPRSYWVVPGALCVGAYPGDPDSGVGEEKLAALLNLGICHVVNLMEAQETDHHGRLFLEYGEKFRQLTSRRGMDASVARFPIRDVSVPSRELMRSILDDIDTSTARGCPVYVHCWGGKGRTGTVVGCYLARHGIATGKKALAMIERLRQHDPRAHEPSPETSAQRAMVVSWEKGE